MLALRFMTIGVILLVVAPVTPAVEIAETEWAVRFVYGHGTARTEPAESSVTFMPKLGARLGESAWMQVSARARLDTADELEPGEPAYDYYSDASAPWAFDDDATAELRDFYVELPVGRHLLRLGKQQIAWGNLDGLRVLDQMNPHSFREFILADFDESRVNLWSAYLDARLARWRAELVWTPDTTVHDIPEPGAWFEFQAPRFRYGAVRGAELPEITTELPSSMLDDGTYGLRLSRPVGRFDVRLQAQSGLDYEPLARIERGPTGPRLVQYYQRRELYGVSIDGMLGGLVLRTELAAQPGRRYNLRLPSGLEEGAGDQWTAGLGVDIDAPFKTFVNVQYVYDAVTDADPGLVRPEEEHTATVTLRRSFAYDAVTAELRWYGTLDENDGLARAALSWAIGNSTSLAFGADVFYGESAGLFGQFDERDRVSASITIVF